MRMMRSWRIPLAPQEPIRYLRQVFGHMVPTPVQLAIEGARFVSGKWPEPLLPSAGGHSNFACARGGAVFGNGFEIHAIPDLLPDRPILAEESDLIYATYPERSGQIVQIGLLRIRPEGVVLC